MPFGAPSTSSFLDGAHPANEEPNWLLTPAGKLVPTPPPINIVPVHFPDRDLAAARVLKKDVGEAVVIEMAFQFGSAIDRYGLGRAWYHNLRVVRVRV
jgi:hypothetical protein